MTDKYLMTDNVQEFTIRGSVVELRQIMALRDIRPSSKNVFLLPEEEIIKKGTFGGFVRQSNSLSQEGECWIDGDSTCSGNSVISGDAHVCDGSQVDSTTRVMGKSVVSGSSLGWSKVSGRSVVRESSLNTATVRDDCKINNSRLCSAVIENSARIHHSKVEHSRISGEVHVSSSTIFGGCQISGYISINNTLFGNEELPINLIVSGRCRITIVDDVVRVPPVVIHNLLYSHAVTITDSKMFIGCTALKHKSWNARLRLQRDALEEKMRVYCPWGLTVKDMTETLRPLMARQRSLARTRRVVVANNHYRRLAVAKKNHSPFKQD